MNQPFTVQALAPWLWLLDREAGGVALDASGTDGRLAMELSGHFREVETLKPGQQFPSWLADVPWTPQTFDCIALHEAVSAVGGSASTTVVALQQLRGLLKPGGWLAAASPNPSFLGNRGTPRSGIAPGQFARHLKKSGFSDVRRMYLTPSLDQPRSLIPDSRRAVNGYEAFEPNTVSKARGVFARLGVHRALYPAYFILARA